jgi:hypothetical protein
MTVLLGVEKQKNIRFGVQKTRKDRKVTGSEQDRLAYYGPPQEARILPVVFPIELRQPLWVSQTRSRRDQAA